MHKCIHELENEQVFSLDKTISRLYFYSNTTFGGVTLVSLRGHTHRLPSGSKCFKGSSSMLTSVPSHNNQ